MKNKLLTLLANITCAFTWAIIVTSLPFIEEHFDPSGPNDSWQRGIVFAPFMAIAAIFVFYLVTKRAVKNGHTAYFSFVTRSSLYCYTIFLAFALPAFCVAFYIEIMPRIDLLIVSTYMSFIVFLTQIIPLSFWWLIRLRRS
jgi:hypothetical protein